MKLITQICFKMTEITIVILALSYAAIHFDFVANLPITGKLGGDTHAIMQDITFIIVAVTVLVYKFVEEKNDGKPPLYLRATHKWKGIYATLTEAREPGWDALDEMMGRGPHE